MNDKLYRNLWVDYLRSALTVLVVAHHSALAYTTFATFNKDAYILSTHAIVDTKRWIGLDIFVGFNDVFFMSLMFLIGGLFLSGSIKKKGMLSFIKDRLYRLLIPFLFGGTALMLIAYFPSYYVAHDSTDVAAYIKDFFFVEQWPVGPPWFIWLLFVFNLLFAFTYKLFRTSDRPYLNLKNRPVLTFIILFLISWLLYVPLVYQLGPNAWTGFGPFDFQINRILLYFGYFIIGILIGNSDFNTNLFSNDGLLVRGWWIWIILSIAIFTLLTLIPLQLTLLQNENIYYMFYIASCCISCMAFVTTFRKLANVKIGWWDSLTKNAYLIYLTHYVFVTWIQFALMSCNLSAIVKSLITFVLALAMSWGVSIVLRKNSIINKYL